MYSPKNFLTAHTSPRAKPRGLSTSLRSGLDDTSSTSEAVGHQQRSTSEAVAHQKEGFTLIELSIVIVIIGLLVGGALVGQDLIKAAQIRSTVSEIEKLNVSVNTFRLKYNCLAGDCPNVTTFFTATTQPDQVVNGNGNRVIEGVNGQPSNVPSEQLEFFDHLAAAELISLPTFDDTFLEPDTPGVNYITTPVGNGIWIGNTDGFGDMLQGQQLYLLGFHLNSDDEWIDTSPSNIPAIAAFSIDSKIDDGLPMSGNVRASVQVSEGDDILFGYADTPGASGTCVTTASGNPYSVSDEDMCALQIVAGF